MRKIINRKLYDTNTAEELLAWSNSYSPNDFHYCLETLYRKRTGEFFLCGEGGPLSPYAERVGNRGAMGGERIIPMTEDEARDWVEAHFDADEYIDIFGELEE